MNSLRSSAGHCRPRFSFFHMKLSKNRPWHQRHRPIHAENQTRQPQPAKPEFPQPSRLPPAKPGASLPAQGPRPSGRTRKECHFRNSPLKLSIDRSQSTVSLATNHTANLRAHSATASGAPPSLCRYIDPAQANCQLGFFAFFKLSPNAPKAWG